MALIMIGQIVELNDGRQGTVRFTGQTSFAAGDWVGVELNEETGKNDGSIQNVRYFDCEPGKGMFVRPTTIEILQQPAPAVPKPAATTAGRRASSQANTALTGASRRPSTINDPSLGKRMSLNAPSPSPVPRPSRPSSIARSPIKSPTKQLTRPSSTATNSRTGTPSSTRPSTVGTKSRASVGGTRTSMGPPALPSATGRRPAAATSSSVASRTTVGTTRPPGGRLSSAPGRGGMTRPASVRILSGESSENESSGRAGLNSPAKSDEDKTSSPVLSKTKALEKLTSGASKSTTTPKSSRPSVAPAPGSARPAANDAVRRENEDLKSTLKIVEKQKQEYREKLDDMESLQRERDRIEATLKKIEVKLKTTSKENNGLRKELEETRDKLEAIEKKEAEHDSILELATMDKDIAEENAALLEDELEELKQKVEELTLEVDVLQGENEELTQGMSSDERASSGWLQMERQNARLREALIKLRDLGKQSDEESNSKIKQLEADLEEFDAIKEYYAIAKEKLLEADIRTEDLRQQLDDRLGADEMLENLISENGHLTEEISELKRAVAELEELKEISDELEINHVQNEREMQEEIDRRDAKIAELLRTAAEREDVISDMEYTLSRFRELVTNMQTDLEDMRASHAVNEAEAEQLNSKSRAMMDLNQKLRISATKAQVKTIDLELQRMDAQEAQQHLQIVTLFLPESYKTDRDSVLALLRFKRLRFKANLLHDFVKERVGGQPHPGHEDDAFAGCDTLDKLTWVSSMCDRFVNAISHCTLEEFGKYEGALYELEPVERALNSWIDGLRREDLNEKQCATELQRTIALMTHLAEVHISQGLESFADEVQMKTVLVQSHLGSAASVFHVVQDLVRRVIPPGEEEDALAQYFAKRIEAVISQTRSAKVVASKAVRSLEDLRARSLALAPDTAEAFEQCEKLSQELVTISRKIGVDLHSVLTEEGRTEPFTYSEVQSTIARTIMTAYNSAEIDLFSSCLAKLRILAGQLSDLAAVCSDLSQTQEFERSQAPWILRAEELRAIKTIPVDAEEELRQLKDHYNDARRAIALRDENISTAALRIETLEARMRDANTKTSRIVDLEAQLAAAHEQAASLRKDIEQQDREAKTLEADRDKWKKITSDGKTFGDATAAGAKSGQERAVATAREMEALKSEIKALEEAVRFLREDNRRARLTEQPNYEWLSEPLKRPKSVAEQRRALVEAEGKECMRKLLEMATTTRPFDLSTLPKDKLAWKPYSSTPQHHAAKQQKEWRAWKEWEASVIAKTEQLRLNGRQEQAAARRLEQTKTMRPAAASLQIRLPDHRSDGGKTVRGAGSRVQILNARDWEDVLGPIVTR